MASSAAVDAELTDATATTTTTESSVSSQPEAAPNASPSPPRPPVVVQYCPFCTLPYEYCEFGPLYNEKCKPNIMKNFPHLITGNTTATANTAASSSSSANTAAITDTLAATSISKKPTQKGKVDKVADDDEGDDDDDDDDDGEDEGESKTAGAAAATSTSKPWLNKNKTSTSGVLISKSQRQRNKFTTSVKNLDLYGADLKKAAKSFSKKFACSASVVKLPDGGHEIQIQGDVSLDLPDFIVSECKIDKSLLFFQDPATKKKTKCF